MTLHNFIRESNLEDEFFDNCDEVEDDIVNVDEPLSSQPFTRGMEGDMNAFRDSIVDVLMSMGE
jgi:hypothetical protein